MSAVPPAASCNNSTMSSDFDLSDGVTFEEVDHELIGAFLSQQKSYKCPFVRFMPFNQVMPKCFAPHEKRLKNFDVRPDDVWISSFPKCGTTWTQEMVWCLMNRLDFESAKKTKLDNRVPYLELCCMFDTDIFGPPTTDTVQMVETMASPRIIKTHFSFEMLPKQTLEKKPKLIYVTRNPRDACVSYFNHWCVLEGYYGSLQTFVDAFLNDVAGYYTPFIPHVLSYWNARSRYSNLLFLTYEEMQKDLASVVRRTARFLGVSVPEGEAMSQLLDHLSFDKMKNNDAVNKSDMVETTNEALGNQHEKTAFMNKGKTGNWKSHLTSEETKRFEQWEKKHLQGSDLEFQYE